MSSGYGTRAQAAKLCAGAAARPDAHLGAAALLPGRAASSGAGLALLGTGGGSSAGLWCSVHGTVYIFIYKQGQQCCDVAMRNSCSGAGCSRKIWCCSSNGEIRARPKPGEVSAHRLPSGLPSSPPGARCKGVAGLSACRQTSLARRVSGVDGDDLSAPTTHKEYSVQVLCQHLKELHVCTTVKEDQYHNGTQ